ncbi:Hypothetical predicted protein [Drosophila guanche]|uniref:Uncharacterized protein n=1 Tax=Drosophila guanche TaxID=7266 RepID=A0A3B0K2H8_DROGU|nr:Hypothetical predicted protein [Drosophila guanche]
MSHRRILNFNEDLERRFNGGRDENFDGEREEYFDVEPDETLFGRLFAFVPLPVRNTLCSVAHGTLKGFEMFKSNPKLMFVAASCLLWARLIYKINH